MNAGDPLRALARDLRAVNVEAVARPILSKAGAQMRDRARQAAPTGPHIPGYARTIIFQKKGPMRVEVGAMGVGQGNLSAVLEFGQGRNAPHPHILPQLDPEADVAARYIADGITAAVRR